MRPIFYCVLIICIGVSYGVGKAIGKNEGSSKTWTEATELVKSYNVPVSYSVHSLHDYQLDVHMDTIWLYEGDRLVDRWITDYTSKIDSVILKDNE